MSTVRDTHPSMIRDSHPTQPAFDPAQPAGGNPKEVDVNAQYQGFEYHYTYLVRPPEDLNDSR